MNKLRSVLFNTLKSLNQVNSRLARYFVQHHPSLNKVYKKMTGHSVRPLVVTTNRIADLRHKDTINTTTKKNPKVVKITHKAMTNTVHLLPSGKIKPEVENNVTHASDLHTESKPTLVELSEFAKQQPMQNKNPLMNVGNITTRSLTANKVSSNAIRANKIIANNVVVNRKRKQNKNTFQYQDQTKPKNERRIQPVSFSFRNNDVRGSGFGLIRPQPIIYSPSLFDNTKQFDRRNFFPPRHNTDHSNNYLGSRTLLISQPRQMQPVQRNFNMQLQNMNSQPNFQRQQSFRNNVATVSMGNRNPDPQFSFSMPKQRFTQQQRRMPTQIRTQPTNHHRKPWFDSWSDFSDSDDEYYDDEYEESSVETAKQSILRGTNINAGAINAHSLVANSVKADIIDVHKVIANDVVVSARYGK
jgi:hypothetical protein